MTPHFQDSMSIITLFGGKKGDKIKEIPIIPFKSGDTEFLRKYQFQFWFA